MTAMEPTEVHDDAQSGPILAELVVDDRDAPVATAMPPSAASPVEPRWGFWATVGFCLVVAAAFLALQTAVVIGWVIVQIASTGKAPYKADAVMLGSDGLVLAIATLITMPACLGLVVLFAKLKRGASVAGYLGLRAVSPRVALAWLGCLLAYAVATDGLTYALGRRIVPEFMANAYQTAGVLPLLWIALLAMPPLFEEPFVRGFMLEGFRRTRLGATGAVVVTSAVWAGVHLQYGFYEIAVIFVGGLLLGTAKLRTGSIYVPMAMHCLQNLIATAEAAIYVRLNS